MDRQLGFNYPAQYHGLFRHFGPYYERYLDIIVHAGDIKPAVVLDLACGLGNFTSILARRFAQSRIHGLDISPAYIEFAQTHHSDPRISYSTSPAQSLAGLSWIGEVDTIFIKGSYHLFESTLPLEAFLQPAFRNLRSIVVIEKTARSLETYPVPKAATALRRGYVSLDLSSHRARAPEAYAIKSVSYGEVIVVPRDDYSSAVLSRQFSYLAAVPDAELQAWAATMPEVLPIRLFEENVANIYQLK